MAPAARCAPGGEGLAACGGGRAGPSTSMVTLSRPAGGGLAQRAGQAAGGGRSRRRGGLAGAGDARRSVAGVRRPKTRAAASPAWRRAFSRPRGPQPHRAGKGAAARTRPCGVLDPGGRLADRRRDRRRRPARLGRVGLRGGLVGRDAEDAAPAAAEPHHGLRVVVAGAVGLAPHLAELAQLLLADRGGDRLRDRLGLGGLEDAGVFAGEDQRGGRPGLGRARGRGSGGGEVADHDLAGAGAQPGPVTGRRVTWRASIRDSSSAVAAADQAASVPLGARQREWAACAHSCTVAPHRAG